MSLSAEFPTVRPDSEVQASPLRVVKRNGQSDVFDAGKISVAVTKAFLAVEGREAAGSSRVHDLSLIHISEPTRPY